MCKALTSDKKAIYVKWSTAKASYESHVMNVIKFNQLKECSNETLSIFWKSPI